jgi:hypothetical protein
MAKIGTHNSATGERGYGRIDRILSIFARCQNKTIKEQYEAGCRYFDIRYKWSDERGCYVCAHGWWTCEKTLSQVLSEIDNLGKCYVMVTCEQGAPLRKTSIQHIIENHTNICFTTFNRKKPIWRCDYCNKALPHVNGYRVLDWSSWHTLIPIPWLWKQEPQFNADIYTFTDFL